ncbi:Uncharacterised protein [Mycobacteroides abscessus subsp. abscessus]|nr:Uncharacterised protein [Mycobacteroides abscessus subsp. abscessus]
MRELPAVVELALEGFDEALRELDDADLLRPVRRPFQPLSEREDDVGIRPHLLADLRPLHLDRNDLPFPRHRTVDLRHRGGREGHFVETFEHLGDGTAPLGLQLFLHLGEGNRRNAGLEFGELLDELVRDHVTAGGDELPELDERHPGRGQRIAGRRRDLPQGHAQGRDAGFEVAGETELDEDLLDLGEPVDSAVPGGDLRRRAQHGRQGAGGQDEFDGEEDEHLEDDGPREEEEEDEDRGEAHVEAGVRVVLGDAEELVRLEGDGPDREAHDEGDDGVAGGAGADDHHPPDEEADDDSVDETQSDGVEDRHPHSPFVVRVRAGPTPAEVVGLSCALSPP